jgi:hypothetical protein
MAQRSTSRLLYNERDIQLAIQAIDSNRIAHVTTAAAAFCVPETTLRDQRARKPTRRDCEPNSKKLTELEEEVIVRYILDLD